MVMALDKMPALSDYGAIIAQFLPFVVLIVVLTRRLKKLHWDIIKFS